MTPRRGPGGKFVKSTKKAGSNVADSADIPRDDDGGLIDPPTIPAYERELQDAHARGDAREIQGIQARYDDAREDRVQADANRDDDDDNGSDGA